MPSKKKMGVPDSQKAVIKLYNTIIEDVTDNMRDDFLDEGFDEAIIQEFKYLWRHNMMSKDAVKIDANEFVLPGAQAVPKTLKKGATDAVDSQQSEPTGASSSKTAGTGNRKKSPSLDAEDVQVSSTGSSNSQVPDFTHDSEPLSDHSTPKKSKINASDAEFIESSENVYAPSCSKAVLQDIAGLENFIWRSEPSACANNRDVRFDVAIPPLHSTSPAQKTILTIVVPKWAAAQTEIDPLLTPYLVETLHSLAPGLQALALQNKFDEWLYKHQKSLKKPISRIRSLKSRNRKN